jgi:methyl-accepting chemotaxis protein
MNSEKNLDDAATAITERARDRFNRYRQRTIAETDRFFAKLFVAQWLFGILVSVVISPYTWHGNIRIVNLHVWIAIFLGGAITSLPVMLGWRKPGSTATRYVIAFSQMLYSALLIHLTGGRIETHFYVFVSLGLLARYLDWGVIVVASLTIALDHFARGLVWPMSVYGTTSTEWWRFIEHGFWVVVGAIWLIVSSRIQIRGWLAAAEETGMIEAMAEGDRRKEAKERQRGTL